MITKVGYYATSLLTSGLGGLRGADLSAAEEEALKNYYGLDPSSNLALRNAGRGLAGGVVGGMAGNTIGKMISGDVNSVTRAINGQPTSFLGRTVENIVNIPADVKAGVANVGRVANGKAPVIRGGGGKAGAVVRGASAIIPLVGRGIGTIAGAKIMSDKYSKGNAQRIMPSPVPQPNYWG